VNESWRSGGETETEGEERGGPKSIIREGRGEERGDGKGVREGMRRKEGKGGIRGVRKGGTQEGG